MRRGQKRPAACKGGHHPRQRSSSGFFSTTVLRLYDYVRRKYNNNILYYTEYYILCGSDVVVHRADNVSRETMSYVGLVATAIISSDNNDNYCESDNSVTKVGRTEDRERVTAAVQRIILLLCGRITKTRRRRRDGRQ